MHKCFYHSKDLDGRCSGAIIKSDYKAIEMIGMDYGDPFPWQSINPNKDDIIMVDFSLEPFEDMIKLNRMVKSFLWIDHHKTAINNAEKFKDCLDASQSFEKSVSLEKAACELTWEHFYGHSMEAPCGIRLLGRYDIWDHGADDNILPFQLGMLALNTDIDSEIWAQVFSFFSDGFVTQTVEIGNRVQSFIDYKNKWNMRFSFPFKFEGIRFICINNVNTGSPQFDSIWDPDKYDAMMVFYMKPDKKWSFHIYTPKKEIDLSVIAAKYGGGGHSNACGFELRKLPIFRNKTL